MEDVVDEGRRCQRSLARLFQSCKRVLFWVASGITRPSTGRSCARWRQARQQCSHSPFRSTSPPRRRVRVATRSSRAACALNDRSAIGHKHSRHSTTTRFWGHVPVVTGRSPSLCAHGLDWSCLKVSRHIECVIANDAHVETATGYTSRRQKPRGQLQEGPDVLNDHLTLHS